PFQSVCLSQLNFSSPALSVPVHVNSYVPLFTIGVALAISHALAVASPTRYISSKGVNGTISIRFSPISTLILYTPSSMRHLKSSLFVLSDQLTTGSSVPAPWPLVSGRRNTTLGSKSGTV